MDKFVWVEFDTNGQPLRIFRTEEQAKLSIAWDIGLIKAWSRKRAIESIRRQVFERDAWQCVHCGSLLDWNKAEMHEKWPRGEIRRLENGEYRGGEISLDNSETRCHECHVLIAHNREPRWTKASNG